MEESISSSNPLYHILGIKLLRSLPFMELKLLGEQGREMHYLAVNLMDSRARNFSSLDNGSNKHNW